MEEDKSFKALSGKCCPRFGEIAVEMGFITPEQLRQALAEQVDDDIAHNPHRIIGSIFFEKGWMTYKEIEAVLQHLFSERRKAS
ncbi:MAG: hypothetical protein AB1805_10790 [Nitrospirota bacterium]